MSDRGPGGCHGLYIAAIAFCDGDDTHVVTVTLKAERQAKVRHLTDRRGFVSQTSCGICARL
ncbi:MAG: hypothetical protein U5J82_06485 [Desulfobacterales bacterium]|nr:hypothetical protein [Desulfobacterales bacterium]